MESSFLMQADFVEFQEGNQAAQQPNHFSFDAPDGATCCKACSQEFVVGTQHQCLLTLWAFVMDLQKEINKINEREAPLVNDSSKVTQQIMEGALKDMQVQILSVMDNELNSIKVKVNRIEAQLENRGVNGGIMSQ
jgi:hypothetical protein